MHLLEWYPDAWILFAYQYYVQNKFASDGDLYNYS